MGLSPYPGSGWRRLGVLVCLLAFLPVSVVHAAHICPPPAAAGKRTITTEQASAPLCLTCVAMQSSVAAPLFHAASLNAALRNSQAIPPENCRSAVKLFRRFVRPPPAA